MTVPVRDETIFTKFAQMVPQDCVILTLACGKYRFNKLDFGTVAGLPRLLDVGQCNDAYSAVRIATALADAFDTDVNSLPLSMILSWYEQKAVAVLLALLSLGIKNIYLTDFAGVFKSQCIAVSGRYVPAASDQQCGGRYQNLSEAGNIKSWL